MEGGRREAGVRRVERGEGDGGGDGDGDGDGNGNGFSWRSHGYDQAD